MKMLREQRMKIHRIETQMFVSLHVVGAVVCPFVGQAPTTKVTRIVAGQDYIFAYRLIENYHFFTTQITTYGASAIRSRGYICN